MRILLPRNCRVCKENGINLDDMAPYMFGRRVLRNDKFYIVFLENSALLDDDGTIYYTKEGFICSETEGVGTEGVGTEDIGDVDGIYRKCNTSDSTNLCSNVKIDILKKDRLYLK